MDNASGRVVGLRSVAEMDELSSNVLDWLNKSGFPTEYRVAQTLIDHSFITRQGDIYEDIESGSKREIDVIGTRLFNASDSSMLSLTLVVECKSSADKPWVLFQFPKSAVDLSEAFHNIFWQQTSGSDSAIRFFDEVKDKVIQAEGGKSPRIYSDVPHGFSVVQALRKPKTPDASYAASTGVTKAAVSQRQRANSYSEYSSPHVEFVWPVIVLDAPLFLASPDNSGEFELTECDHAVLEWQSTVGTVDRIDIRIVTPDGLPGFLTWATRAFETVIKHAGGELDSMFDSW
jgi:hypothetical protein